MANRRILILDDNEAVLSIVTEALAYERFEVMDISFGYQLLEAVIEFSPHLILMDYRLADANGGDLCSRLKAIRNTGISRLLYFLRISAPMTQIYLVIAMGYCTNLLTCNSC